MKRTIVHTSPWDQGVRIESRRTGFRLLALTVFLTFLISLRAATLHAQSGSDPAKEESGAADEPPLINPPAYCGIYSLYTAMRMFGVSAEFDGLLKPDYISSVEGSTLAQLKAAAEDYVLHALPVTNLSGDILQRSPYPIILHVRSKPKVAEYDHYELFIRSVDGQALLFDAPAPLRLESYATLASRWDGTGLVVSNTPIDLASLYSPTRRRLNGLFIAAIFGFAIVFLLAKGRGSCRPSLPVTRRLICAIHESFAILLVAGMAGVLIHFFSAQGLLAQNRSSDSPTGAYARESFPRLDAAEVEALLSDPQATIIDARYPADYQAGHIEGAINIPITMEASSIRQALQSLPKEERILVYCQSQTCPYAEELSHRLAALGFTNLAIFPGGWIEWTQRHITRADSP